MHTWRGVGRTSARDRTAPGHPVLRRDKHLMAAGCSPCRRWGSSRRGSSRRRRCSWSPSSPRRRFLAYRSHQACMGRRHHSCCHRAPSWICTVRCWARKRQPGRGRGWDMYWGRIPGKGPRHKSRRHCTGRWCRCREVPRNRAGARIDPRQHHTRPTCREALQVGHCTSWACLGCKTQPGTRYRRCRGRSTNKGSSRLGERPGSSACSRRRRVPDKLVPTYRSRWRSLPGTFRPGSSHRWCRRAHPRMTCRPGVPRRRRHRLRRRPASRARS